MRILHLTTQPPSAFGTNAGALRQFELCTRAAQAGHEITVVAPVPAWMREAYRPAEQLTSSGIRLVTTRRRARRELEALSAIARHPGMLLRLVAAPYYGVQSEMYAIDMREAIRAQLAGKPDIVTVEHDFAIRLGDEVGPEIPKVLMTHNCTSAYYGTRAESASSARRTLLSIEGRRVASYVNPRLSGFAGIVTVSTDDAELFRAVTDVPVFVVPNGTALDPARPQPPTGPPELLFTGTIGYAPNRDGILWFVSEIWPHILTQVPDARLLVVGRRPDAQVQRLANSDSRIEVTGEVSEMRPYFERATAVIVPLRSGGGTRLKILDAFASERPVVSTRIGAHGIEVEDGEQLLLGDEPREFAQQVVRLLGDAHLRSRLSINGRRLIDERYHWRAIAEQYIDVLDALI
ncbi:MAG TPA: glycosyltransferase [Solirubrobacteraceae bacterium]